MAPACHILRSATTGVMVTAVSRLATVPTALPVGRWTSPSVADMGAETTPANTAAGRGRPRLTRPRRPGTTAREQILDAAAELFTNHGYASTSTRRIADEVGVRQASLYHHFATKDDILDALLAGTVDEALRLGAELLDGAGPAAQRLHTLAVADAHQLCTGRWNLGALYLLPELRTDRFQPFRQRRAELRDVYRRLSAAVIDECQGPSDAADLPFRLVESVVNTRSDDIESTPAQPWVIAEAALRILGFDGDFRPLATTTAARLGVRPPKSSAR